MPFQPIYLFKIFIKIPSSTAGNVIKPNTSGELDITGKKIAVYSCIVGRYDSIVEPLYIDCDIDYFMFTDLDLPSDSKWKKIDITQFEEYNKLSPIQLNRKIKMLPHIYLKDYDYSIYVDGLIEIVCSMKPLIENMKSSSLGVHFHNQRDCIYDEAIMIKYAKKADMSIVNQQLNIYRNEGFPIHNGLYENTIMIRNHNSQLMCKLMDKWWDEYLKFRQTHSYDRLKELEKNRRLNHIVELNREEQAREEQEKLENQVTVTREWDYHKADYVEKTHYKC